MNRFHDFPVRVLNLSTLVHHLPVSIGQKVVGLEHTDGSVFGFSYSPHSCGGEEGERGERGEKGGGKKEGGGRGREGGERKRKERRGRRERGKRSKQTLKARRGNIN